MHAAFIIRVQGDFSEQNLKYCSDFYYSEKLSFLMLLNNQLSKLLYKLNTFIIQLMINTHNLIEFSIKQYH